MTGKPIPADPVVVADVPVRLSQKSTLDTSSLVEIEGAQTTSVSSWDLLTPPTVRGAPSPINEKSVLIDADGREFEIQGHVARRPEHRPIFLAAAVRLISDMQQQ
ncbi:MAG TPA: hypothetical protein VGL05_08035 [Kribbella sp.]